MTRTSLTQEYPLFLGNIPHGTSSQSLTKLLVDLAECQLRVIKGKNRGKKIKRSAIVYCPTLESREILLARKADLLFCGNQLSLKPVEIMIGNHNLQTDTVVPSISLTGHLPITIPKKVFWSAFSQKFGSCKQKGSLTSSNLYISSGNNSGQSSPKKTSKMIRTNIIFDDKNNLVAFLLKAKRGTFLKIGNWKLCLEKNTPVYDQSPSMPLNSSQQHHRNDTEIQNAEISNPVASFSISKIKNTSPLDFSSSDKVACKAKLILRRLSHPNNQDYIRFNRSTRAPQKVQHY